MHPGSTPELTKSQARRAGTLVRHAAQSSDIGNADSLSEAISIIERYRASFRRPLVTANNGLRSMMKTLGLDGQVTQRLKRMQTILDKLGREHTLTLDRMQDIGGCRAVLPTRSAVYKLAEHIKTVKPTSRVVDYIAEPRRSGYRGIHIIVEYGDPVRPVEIQLRTVLMHAWATTVEDISGTGGVNYKMDGTSPMQVFLECYSRVLECRDLGEKPSKLLMKEYERLFSTAFEE